MAGAVTYEECPTGGGERRRPWVNHHYCGCGLCVKCGFPKHTAIHGPRFGAGPGSEPWGHEFERVP